MRRLPVLLPVLAILMVLSVSHADAKYFSWTAIRSIHNWGTIYIEPKCTLKVDLREHGAQATLDAYFGAKTSFYDSGYSYYYNQSWPFSSGDSLEITTSLNLPRGSVVDSMILWIFGKPEPAKLVSTGQAQATYDNIVKVTRKDPALLTRSWSSGNEDVYSLRIFPVFKDSIRHVRLYLRFVGDPATGMNDLSFGTPGKAAILLQKPLQAMWLPYVRSGSIGPKDATGQRRIFLVSPDTGKLVLSWTEKPQENPVCYGIVDTSRSDTGAFTLFVDYKKLFGLDSIPFKRKLAMVWVPSTSTGADSANPYLTEKNALENYVRTLRREDDFNLVYAGTTAESFDARLTPMNETMKNRILGFVEGRRAPIADGTTRKTFEALKAGFASIAASDTPAIVFCLDRAPARTGGYPNYTDMDAKVTMLVEINVNKAKFYAWIHYSKWYFYSKLAQAMNGKITYSDCFSFKRLDNLFKPAIGTPEMAFDSRGFNVAQKSLPGVYQNYYLTGYGSSYGCDYYSYHYGYYGYSRYYGYDYYGAYWYDDYYTYSPSYQYVFTGRNTGKNVWGVASITIDGRTQEKVIRVENQGGAETGLSLSKLWAVNLVDVFYQWYYWYYRTDNPQVLSPTPDIAACQGSNAAYNDATYRAMVKIGLGERVVTMATSLISLEPGMALVDDPRMEEGSGSDGVATAMEDGVDSLSQAKGREGLSAKPNPFNPTTRIVLSCAQAKGAVVLKIFSVDGRLIRTITAQALNGRAVFEWNGRDNLGRALAAGVYLAQVSVGNRVLETKLMLAK